MQFTAGNVISRAFSVTHKNLVTFLILGVVVMGPILLINHLLLGTMNDIQIVEGPGGARLEVPRVEPRIHLATQILNLVANGLLAGAMAFGVFVSLRGQRPTVGACLSRAFARIVPITLSSLLLWLILGIWFVVAVLLVLPDLKRLLPAILLACIPALFLLCGLFVTIACATVEQAGPIAALRRSWSLTAGRRASIFLMLLMIVAIAMALGLVTGLFVAALGPTVGAVAQVAIAVYLALLIGSLSAVCYHDLRVVKEGATTDDLVKVFG